MIGAATLQSCFQALVERYELAHPAALGGPRELDLSDLSARFQLGPFDQHPLAGLLALRALRDNPALIKLAVLWSEPSTDERTTPSDGSTTPSDESAIPSDNSAIPPGARERLEHELVPGPAMTLPEALAAPGQASPNLRDQLA